MSNIVGTIINLRSFLSVEETQVSVQVGMDKAPAFVLQKGRKYIIPDFQREIRWEKENLIELMADISRGAKFLGNVIVTRRPDKDFEIIDGQQRITILLMLLHYIRVNYKENCDVFESCEIENTSFPGFRLFMKNNFTLEGLSDTEQNRIIASDDFNQRYQFAVLWEEMGNTDILEDSYKAKDFLKNLQRCEFNLIANTDDTTGYSIEYFLDVNLKGVKLDTEDIFKGYLFSNDGGLEIRNSWRELKKLCFQLNQNINYYPIMELFEHYFYCDLYLEYSFKDIVFKKQDFVLAKEARVSGTVHYAGEHIIKVINNNEYMRRCLKNIIDFLRIVIDVVNSDGPTANFSEWFQKVVDQSKIKVIHNFMKKIIMDKEGIPKILVMKYILTVFLNGRAEKKGYDKFFGVYLLSTLFIIFDTKKSSDRIFDIVKNDNWYEKLMEVVQYYFSNSELTERKLTAQYKYSLKTDENNDQIRCKSLATIYNYFQVDDHEIKIQKGKCEEVLEFITNSTKFSFEHFMVNKGKKCGIKIGTATGEYNYPKEVHKYIHSLFNFIFISRDLNSSIENLPVTEKIKLLKDKKDKITCQYSRMVLEIAENEINDWPVVGYFTDKDEMKKKLDEYYLNEFKEDYQSFAKRIILEVIKRFAHS